jgi:hypothetical protein
MPPTSPRVQPSSSAWPEQEDGQMSVIQTGKKLHDDAANISEGTRQSVVRAAGVTQAQVVAAEIAHYTAVVASSRANNNSADIAAPLAALRSLGAAGV